MPFRTERSFFAQLDKLRAELAMQGKNLVSFANYDYLGLATHPLIKAEAKREIDDLGISAWPQDLLAVNAQRTRNLKQRSLNLSAWKAR